MVLEKTLESPMDCKEIKLINPTGNQPWIFIGRTDAEVEAPILWPPDGKSWLIGKGPEAGKDWGHKEKGATMRWLDGITDSMDMGLGGLRSWWWTGRPGMLQSMGSQRVGHDWVSELNWEIIISETWGWFNNKKSNFKTLKKFFKNTRSFQMLRRYLIKVNILF